MAVQEQGVMIPKADLARVLQDGYTIFAGAQLGHSIRADISEEAHAEIGGEYSGGMKAIERIAKRFEIELIDPREALKE